MAEDLTGINEVTYTAPGALHELPPELQELRRLVRSIVERECIPLEAEYLARERESAEQDPGPPTRKGIYQRALPEDQHARLERISRESGIFDAHIPAALGGGGVGVLGRFVIDEEINRSIVALPTARVPGILYGCTPDQREGYLLPTIAGDKSYAFAETEPDGGSDPGNSLRTHAELVGGEWVINGSKMFITYADRADYLLLLAVTNPALRQHGGITMFIVDTESPGLTMEPNPLWFEGRPEQFTLHLNDVRVPEANVLGEVGGGFRLGQQWLMIQDRLTRGSLACGILTRALDMARDWTLERESFGAPLSERQAIQWMMVDIFVDLKCIRAVSYECAARADAGEDVRAYAALAKLLGANWGHRSIDKVMQIFGGMGESLELPISHWYRALRHGRIGGGTDEMQRILIARQIYREGSSLWLA